MELLLPAPLIKFCHDKTSFFEYFAISFKIKLLSIFLQSLGCISYREYANLIGFLPNFDHLFGHCDDMPDLFYLSILLFHSKSVFFL